MNKLIYWSDSSEVDSTLNGVVIEFKASDFEEGQTTISRIGMSREMAQEVIKHINQELAKNSPQRGKTK